MKKKLLSITLISVMTVSLLLSGCGNAKIKNTEDGNTAAASENETETTVVADGEKTKITFYTTQSGTDDQFLDIIAHFEKENQDVEVEYLGYDSSEMQKWMSLFASNSGPTVTLMDPINIYNNRERMATFNPKVDTYCNNVDESALATYTYEGAIYGIPISVQGYGILYNKRAIEEATGEEFDPATIRTRADLADLFKRIEAGGIKASMFTGVNWSLAAHYLGLVFNGCRGDAEGQTLFVNQLKAGEIDLKNDTYWNGYMDTFDLINSYNYNKADPLVGNVDIDAQAFATGKVATWFQGDWSWVQIKDVENRDSEFGILPVFVSDDPDDILNQVIPASAPKAYCVDSSQNNEAQVAAGKRFVEYITMNDYARGVIGEALGATLPFKDSTFVAESTLAQATSTYVEAGKTLDIYAQSLLLPTDFWTENGVPILQYLSDKTDRNSAADAIREYWKKQK